MVVRHQRRVVELGKGLLGAQVGFLNYDHRYTVNPLKDEEKGLISQNIRNTTLHDQDAANKALEAAINLRGAANYQSSPTPGIKAAQDLIAPSFYDISDFPKKLKPLIKPLGVETQADRVTYRFRLTDVARKNFTYTGMPLNGVTKVEEAHTGIKSVIKDRALVLTITNPPQKTLLERIKNPLTLFQPQDPGLNSEWIKAFSKLPKVISSTTATKNPNETEYAFSITEEDWQALPPTDKINFLYKTTTSGPAKKQIKKDFAPFLAYAQAEELQPPHPVKSALSALISTPGAVFGLITIPFALSGKEKARKTEQVLKPLKNIAEVLNLRNTPKVLRGLSFGRKAAYLASKLVSIPLNFAPVVGKKFDAAVIKALCGQEIANQLQSNPEQKNTPVRAAQEQTEKEPEKTKQVEYSKAGVQIKRISKNMGQILKQPQNSSSKTRILANYKQKQERER